MDFSLFAATAGIVALWHQIQGVFNRLRALFITRTVLMNEVANATAAYLYARGRVLNWGDRLIRSNGAWVRPLDRVTEVAFETPPTQPLIVILNGWPVMFHSPSHRDGVAGIPNGRDQVTITALRGTLDIKDLTRAALDYTRELQTTGRRYFVRRCGGSDRRSGNEISSTPHAAPPVGESLSPYERFLHWSPDQIGAPRPDSPFAALSLEPVSAGARREFNQWLTLKPWYQKRGIPWRRGFLFKGPPGTGKTSLARALAQEADLPVFTFDLSTMSNEEFIHSWQNMQEHTPCMALIEDIDGVFKGRVNVHAESLSLKGGALTFDCLLNAMGGIQTADGVFIIITTNHAESLDPALIRPGRLDSHFEIPLPSTASRAEIILRILDEVTEEDLAATYEMSAAAVTDYAIVKALARLEGSLKGEGVSNPAF